MYIMQRYQLYLNPQSVSIVDAFSAETGLGRSKIIRDSIDRLAANLSKVLVAKRGVSSIKGPLDGLIGILAIEGKKPTNIAETIDEIYLTD